MGVHGREVIVRPARPRARHACALPPPAWRGLTAVVARMVLVGQNGRTPLHYAAYFGHVEVVRMLVVEGKADVNVQIKVSVSMRE